jgi:hypothetical protein
MIEDVDDTLVLRYVDNDPTSRGDSFSSAVSLQDMSDTMKETNGIRFLSLSLALPETVSTL